MASKVREVYLQSRLDEETQDSLWLKAFRFAVAANLIVCVSLLPQVLSQKSHHHNPPQNASSDV